MERAVRQAVLEILAERGYEGVTFQRVAHRAGVGQPTLYRRWSSKGEMVEDAIFSTTEWTPPVTTGSLAADLRELVVAIVATLASPPVRSAIPGLLVTYHEDPTRHDRLVERAENPLRDAFRGLLDAAVARGEAAEDLAADSLFDVMLGAAMYHAIVRSSSDVDGVATAVAAVIEHAVRPSAPPG